MKHFVGFLAALIVTFIIIFIWHLLGFDIEKIDYFAGLCSGGAYIIAMKISEEIKYP